MLDLRFIQENLDAVRENCHNRQLDVGLDRLLELIESRLTLIAEQQSLREQRNKLAKEMKGRAPSEEERTLGKALKQREAPLADELRETVEELQALHSQVPNMSHPDAPVLILAR